jgi:hypothetical protein
MGKPVVPFNRPCGATFRSHDGEFFLPISIGRFPAAGMKFLDLILT